MHSDDKQTINDDQAKDGKPCLDMKNNLLFKLAFIATMVIFPQPAIAQIKIGEVRSPTKINANLPTYDTLQLYMDFSKLQMNPNYYTGQEITFMPGIVNTMSSDMSTAFQSQVSEIEYLCDGYDGFFIKNADTEYIIDTVWDKKHKKILNTKYIENKKRYKPQKISGRILYWGSNGYEWTYGGDSYMTNGANFSLLDFKGLATSKEAIECQIFKIHNTTLADDAEYIFELEDKDGTLLTWTVKQYDYKSYNKKLPVVIMAYYNKYNIEYVGNSYKYTSPLYRTYSSDKEQLVANLYNDGKYYPIYEPFTCMEISLCPPANRLQSNTFWSISAGEKDVQFLAPHLVFVDSLGTKFNHILPYTKQNDDYSARLKPIQHNLVVGADPAQKYFNEFALDILVDSIEYNVQLAEKKAALAEKKAAEEQRQKNMVAKFGKEMGNLIINRKVKLGMTKEMCREAWGAPDDINRTIGSWGTHEQWVYSGGNYLYFENGKLTSIQD